METIDALLYEQAERLSNQEWRYVVYSYRSPSLGKMYNAENIDLPGCKAQGPSVKEALVNLDSARTDYIYSMLLDGLDIPDPNFNNTFGHDPSDHTKISIYF